MPVLWNNLAYLLHDPPPEYVFELSEGGIAWARRGGTVQPQWTPLERGVLAVSPLADNVLKPEALADAVRAITGAGGTRKRRRVVLVLPDYCARVAVLEFDQFPSDYKEQLSLVKFRMKKSVPFDVDSAAVSFHPQVVKGAPTEVAVVVAALEIVARYEAPFRAAGLHPGLVTTSALAMSELNHAPGVSILVRFNGRVLTVLVMNGPVLRLVRSVELADVNSDELLAVLLPTLAYIEDEMKAQPARIIVCGFGPGTPEWANEFAIPVEPLRSRLGMPSGTNAGLFGYLESSMPGVKVA